MQKDAAHTQEQQPKAKPNVQRFTGGGFNLAV